MVIKVPIVYPLPNHVWSSRNLCYVSIHFRRTKKLLIAFVMNSFTFLLSPKNFFHSRILFLFTKSSALRNVSFKNSDRWHFKVRQNEISPEASWESCLPCLFIAIEELICSSPRKTQTSNETFFFGWWEQSALERFKATTNSKLNWLASWKKKQRDRGKY